MWYAASYATTTEIIAVLNALLALGKNLKVTMMAFKESDQRFHVVYYADV